MDWTARKTTVELKDKDGKPYQANTEVACFTLKGGEQFAYQSPCRVIQAFAEFSDDGRCTVALSSGGIDLQNPRGHAVHHFKDNSGEQPVVSFDGNGTCEVELTVVPE